MLLKVSSLEWMFADCAVNSVLDEVKLHYSVINNLALLRMTVVVCVGVVRVSCVMLTTTSLVCFGA